MGVLMCVRVSLQLAFDARVHPMERVRRRLPPVPVKLKQECVRITLATKGGVRSVPYPLVNVARPSDLDALGHPVGDEYVDAALMLAGDGRGGGGYC